MATLFEPVERAFAQAVSRLAYANPFDYEGMHRLEMTAAQIDVPLDVSGIPLRSVAVRPNIPGILRKAEALTEEARERVLKFGTSSEDELRLYEDLSLFVVYFCYRDRLLVDDKEPGSAKIFETEYPRFKKDFRRYLTPIWKLGFREMSAAHIIACFFQLRRAHRFIHTKIFGQSRPIQRLRADVWNSVFTHDIRRYRDVMYHQMHDITTLITGPSGTGKDLVAEAIGLSRYVAFQPKSNRFAESVAGAFHAVNLTALSPQIIESELFGVSKGAFTDAVEREGWFDICQPSHTVFLDEIGELDPAIQVKLLRLLHNRTFQRLGESVQRRFEGKIIAATNRDLNVEIQEGRFRRDFFYRLCSDQITTPSLRAQLDADENELPRLIEFIAVRHYGTAAQSLTEDVMAWIEQKLGPDYAWPGNVRELEQCIRNVLVRGEYQPLLSEARDDIASFTQKVEGLEYTADELMRYYCTLAYAKTGSYVAASQVLGLNRRTVKDRIDETLLSSLTAE